MKTKFYNCPTDKFRKGDIRHKAYVAMKAFADNVGDTVYPSEQMPGFREIRVDVNISLKVYGDGKVEFWYEEKQPDIGVMFVVTKEKWVSKLGLLI